MLDTVHMDYNGVFEAVVGVDSSSSTYLLLTSVQCLMLDETTLIIARLSLAGFKYAASSIEIICACR